MSVLTKGSSRVHISNNPEYAIKKIYIYFFFFNGTWSNSLGTTILFSTAVVFPHQFLMFSLRGYTNLKLTHLGPKPL